MPIQIGCRFTGKYAGHQDLATGDYWEVLPPIDGHARKIQAMLLAKPTQRRETLLQRLLPNLKRASA